MTLYTTWYTLSCLFYDKEFMKQYLENSMTILQACWCRFCSASLTRRCTALPARGSSSSSSSTTGRNIRQSDHLYYQGIPRSEIQYVLISVDISSNFSQVQFAIDFSSPNITLSKIPVCHRSQFATDPSYQYFPVCYRSYFATYPCLPQILVCY